MHNTVENLLKIKEKVKGKFDNNEKLIKTPEIIAVSKTFKLDHIMPLINNGHTHYGENKVQEASEKWTKIKNNNNKIKLHLIGRLQTNKVKLALSLFDFIHSLDNKRLADKICKTEKELNKKIKIFIQVNIGNEVQKSGIPKNEVFEFYDYCKNLDLDIIGLMCIPPFGDEVNKYFLEMFHFKKLLKLSELSMGMSSDYLEATENGATYLRIGSQIFGERV